MSNLNDYAAGSVNWRKTLRENTNRTYIVIGLFFLIYLGIGLLIDTFLYSEQYPNASLGLIFHGLITLKLYPIATAVMLVIASVSLLVTYAMSDRLMLLGTSYHQVTASSARSDKEKQLYNIVEEMKIAAGLNYMPKVYVIQADYMNAFASGYSEKSAMVAITTGLMEKLDRDELQAVMAHELSHIKHMDIKLTLTASMLANLTIIVIDIFFHSLIFTRRGSRSKNGGIVIAVMLLRYLLPLVNVVLLLYLSRKRELMADAGCVALTRTNEPLARALMKISGDYTENRQKYTQQSQQTAHESVRREAYIFDPLQAGIKPLASVSDVFSTHPSLEKRLKALGFDKKQ